MLRSVGAARDSGLFTVCGTQDGGRLVRGAAPHLMEVPNHDDSRRILAGPPLAQLTTT